MEGKILDFKFPCSKREDIDVFVCFVARGHTIIHRFVQFLFFFICDYSRGESMIRGSFFRDRFFFHSSSRPIEASDKKVWREEV